MLAQLTSDAELVAAEMGLRQRHINLSDPPQHLPQKTIARDLRKVHVYTPPKGNVSKLISGMSAKDSECRVAIKATVPYEHSAPLKTSTLHKDPSVGTLSSVSAVSDGPCPRAIDHDSLEERKDDSPALRSPASPAQDDPLLFNSPVPAESFRQLGLRVPDDQELRRAATFRVELEAMRATHAWHEIPLSFLVDRQIDDTAFDKAGLPEIDIDARVPAACSGREPNSAASSDSDASVFAWATTLFPCLDFIVR